MKVAKPPSQKNIHIPIKIWLVSSTVAFISELRYLLLRNAIVKKAACRLDAYC